MAGAAESRDRSESKRLAQFTRSLLEQRLAQSSAVTLVLYQTGDGRVLSREEFWLYVATIEPPIKIDSSIDSDSTTLTARALTGSEASLLAEHVRVHQIGLCNLASERGEQFSFGVEGTEEQLEFGEFLTWMEQYDLGDLGAYNGNWRSDSKTDNKWTLVLEVSSVRWRK